MIVGLLGANGQLGQEIQQVLIENDLSCTLRLFTRKNFDIETVSHNVRLAECDYVINTIAYHKPVDELENNLSEAILVNTEFPARLAKLCKINDVGLVHISTDYVYNGEINRDHTEYYNENPQNVYGLTKLWGEQGIQHYCERYFILRVASIFGQKGPNFVDNICAGYAQQGEVTLPRDQFMSPTSCDTIAKTIFLLMSGDEKFGVYNCCDNGESVSWYDFTKAIFKLRNLSTDCIKKKKYVENITVAVRPQFSGMSNAKLQSAFPMLILPTWKESLKSYIDKKDDKV